MPIIKTNVRTKGRAARSNERLELIDQILCNGTYIDTREKFLKLVNRSMPPGTGNITVNTLDKDITYLRGLLGNLMLNEGSEVTLDFTKGRGYHYSERGFSYFKNLVNDSDKNLLMLASNLFNVFKGTALQEAFSEVVNKVLSESLTGGPLYDLSNYNFVQMESRYSINATKWIPELLKAIYERNTLKVTYKGFNKDEKEKNICPHVLKQYNGRWYVVAYDHNCERKNKTSVFALDGIKHLELSGVKYIVSADFSAEDYFRYSIGVWHWHDEDPIEVVLEFSRYIEMVQTNPLHHSQKTELSKDGKKLTVTIEVYHSPELEMIIQGFGNAVKVISPVSLAEKILESAKSVTTLY